MRFKPVGFVFDPGGEGRGGGRGGQRFQQRTLIPENGLSIVICNNVCFYVNCCCCRY